MSEQNLDLGAMLYHLFRRDIGRKLTALLLAIFLFVAIDRQVRDDQTLTIPVSYKSLDEIESGDYEATSLWRLLVATGIDEGGRSLVIPESARRRSMQLRLSGPRAVLEELRQRSMVAKYFPERAGKAVPVTLADLRGVEEVIKRLGADNVQIEEDFYLDIAEEEEREITLRRGDLAFTGQPESGWELVDVQFEPGILRIKGVAQHLKSVEEDRQSLFRPVSLRNLKERIRVPLQVSSVLQNDVRFAESRVTPHVNLSFERILVEVPAELGGRFRCPVSLRFDYERLETRRRELFDQGDRPMWKDLDSAQTLYLEVQLFLAEGEVRSGRSFVDDPIRDRIELVAAVERETVQIDKEGNVPILVFVLPDSEDPRPFEVKLVDPETGQPPPRSYERKVEWRKPGEVDTPAATSTDENGP